MLTIPLQAAGAIAFLFGLVSLIVHLAIILWVYSDAQRPARVPVGDRRLPRPASRSGVVPAPRPEV